MGYSRDTKKHQRILVALPDRSILSPGRRWLGTEARIRAIISYLRHKCRRYGGELKLTPGFSQSDFESKRRRTKPTHSSPMPSRPKVEGSGTGVRSIVLLVVLWPAGLLAIEVIV
jgi:hypothetical protein